MPPLLRLLTRRGGWRIIVSVHRRDLNWDNMVALGYAAEQLFMAAQFLTSNTVPLEHGIQQACRCLQNLLGHDNVIPSYLITWIDECVKECRETGTDHRAQRVEQLSATIVQVLEEVHRMLGEPGPATERVA